MLRKYISVGLIGLLLLSGCSSNSNDSIKTVSLNQQTTIDISTDTNPITHVVDQVVDDPIITLIEEPPTITEEPTPEPTPIVTEVNIETVRKYEDYSCLPEEISVQNLTGGVVFNVEDPYFDNWNIVYNIGNINTIDLQDRTYEELSETNTYKKIELSVICSNETYNKIIEADQAYEPDWHYILNPLYDTEVFYYELDGHYEFIGKTKLKNPMASSKEIIEIRLIYPTYVINATVSSILGENVDNIITEEDYNKIYAFLTSHKFIEESVYETDKRLASYKNLTTTETHKDEEGNWITETTNYEPLINFDELIIGNELLGFDKNETGTFYDVDGLKYYYVDVNSDKYAIDLSLVFNTEYNLTFDLPKSLEKVFIINADDLMKLVVDVNDTTLEKNIKKFKKKLKKNPLYWSVLLDYVSNSKYVNKFESNLEILEDHSGAVVTLTKPEEEIQVEHIVTVVFYKENSIIYGQTITIEPSENNIVINIPYKGLEDFNDAKLFYYERTNISEPNDLNFKYLVNQEPIIDENIENEEEQQIEDQTENADDEESLGGN